MNPKAYFYNTALSVQICYIAGLSFKNKKKFYKKPLTLLFLKSKKNFKVIVSKMWMLGQTN